jgi:transcriptional regulator with XRE-family HTH domain
MFIRTVRDVGILIRGTRKSLGWSQSALAQQVGTTQKWISFVENGSPGAQLDLVLRTQAALRVDLEPHLQTDSRRSKKPSLIDQVADRHRRGSGKS